MKTDTEQEAETAAILAHDFCAEKRIVEVRDRILAIAAFISGYKAKTVTSGDVLEELGEKEIMIEAFDKVRQLFERRSWIMDGRGSYPYNDDRYKQEVRYLYDEFDALKSDVWKNIKTKTFEYREKIISDYIKNEYTEIIAELNDKIEAYKEYLKFVDIPDYMSADTFDKYIAAKNRMFALNNFKNIKQELAISVQKIK